VYQNTQKQQNGKNTACNFGEVVQEYSLILLHIYDYDKQEKARKSE
jgi:hypothetical protein